MINIKKKIIIKEEWGWDFGKEYSYVILGRVGVLFKGVIFWDGV